jgi:succinate-semialdehyde dehydrogenase/glutarate-semialdehyde dehydrogenase
MNRDIAYPEVLLHVAGHWRNGASGERLAVINPANENEIGSVAKANLVDVDEAAVAAASGFLAWRHVCAFERSKIMRRVADNLRARVDMIAPLMTLEQGKPILEARAEILAGADIIDWFAEEGRRAYGRVIPSRAQHVRQIVVKEPVGPVAAFTPWNFPVNQAVRKISAALAAGCSIVLKGPEETPASCAELVRAFVDADLPAGVVNLVFGNPAEISGYLIPHPLIRKISFTGSTIIGKQLAALAGAHMKRVTMELGGHAPVIVCDDVDVGAVARSLSATKFRNAGQTCISPTRFIVHQKVHDEFVKEFTRAAKAIKVGNGFDDGTEMGPLANARRVDALALLIDDAVHQGATIAAGAEHIPGKGYWFEPTVLLDVPVNARVMNEEPFGPVALINRFENIKEAIAEANRLPFGLAAYVYSRSQANIAALSAEVESGMIAVNHQGLSFPELPFGGVKDSGYGSEGGTEALEAYLCTKLVTEAS